MDPRAVVIVLRESLACTRAGNYETARYSMTVRACLDQPTVSFGLARPGAPACPSPSARSVCRCNRANPGGTHHVNNMFQYLYIL
jgi:hypothetical protein